MWDGTVTAQRDGHNSCQEPENLFKQIRTNKPENFHFQ